MNTPKWFEEELDFQSRGRYRLRWSVGRQRWQIEEKQERARTKTRPISAIDDEGIREIEGYSLVSEIAPGTRAKCDRCFSEMRVTEQKFKTTKCPGCGKEHVICYWELGEGLLEHMRKINPDSGGIDRVFTEVDAKTKTRNIGRQRDLRNTGESILKADYNFIHDIPSWGYTGTNKFLHRDKSLR